MTLFKQMFIRGMMTALLACAIVAGAKGADAFKHPGVLVTRSQLEFVRDRVRAGDQPWTAAFETMLASRYAALSYQPKPRPVVECGAYSRPNHGCTDERNDAIAAYTHAMLWALTGKEAHARKSIELMNAWAAVLKTHEGHNAPLQAAWSASIWPRAAEIIRHTSEFWTVPEIERFSALLRDAYLPYIVDPRSDYNGNWHLSMIEAQLAVAVFLDDRKQFDRGIARWRRRTPAYFYLSSDGDAPVPPPGRTDTRDGLVKYWYGQEKFVDGLGQETCRDFGHLQMGLAAMVNAAETAFIQGVDLYAEESKRITAAMEFHAGFLLGEPIPEWLGGGKLDLRAIDTWEIAFNHFHNRRQHELPHTEKLLMSKLRPTGVSIFMIWETLTHADTGKR